MHLRKKEQKIKEKKVYSIDNGLDDIYDPKLEICSRLEMKTFFFSDK